MTVVIFFACLDLEQKSSFLDGHYVMKLGGVIIDPVPIVQAGIKMGGLPRQSNRRAGEGSPVANLTVPSHQQSFFSRVFTGFLNEHGVMQVHFPQTSANPSL